MPKPTASFCQFFIKVSLIFPKEFLFPVNAEFHVHLGNVFNGLKQEDNVMVKKGNLTNVT